MYSKLQGLHMRRQVYKFYKHGPCGLWGAKSVSEDSETLARVRTSITRKKDNLKAHPGLVWLTVGSLRTYCQGSERSYCDSRIWAILLSGVASGRPAATSESRKSGFSRVDGEIGLVGDLGWVAASVFGNATKMVTRTVRQGSGVSKRIRTATVEGWALLDIPAGLCRLEEPPNLLGILFSFVSPAMRVLPKFCYQEHFVRN